jgi:hypothetical protein
MALKPDAVEIMRGIQRSLMTHVLPEVSTAYATAQVHYAVLLLNALVAEWDGAAQRLVEDNAELRAFCGRTAGQFQDTNPILAADLAAVVIEQDADLRLSTLGGANDRLRALVAAVEAAIAAGDVEAGAQIRQDSMQVLLAGMRQREVGAV